MKRFSRWVRYAVATAVVGSAAGITAEGTNAVEPDALQQALMLPSTESSHGSVSPVTHWADAGNDNASIEEQFTAMQEQLAAMDAELSKVAEEAGDTTIVHSGSSKSTMKVEDKSVSQPLKQ